MGKVGLNGQSSIKPCSFGQVTCCYGRKTWGLFHKTFFFVIYGYFAVNYGIFKIYEQIHSQNLAVTTNP